MLRAFGTRILVRKPLDKGLQKIESHGSVASNSAKLTVRILEQEATL